MIFQTIRKSFGLQTVLLRVNSVAALSGAPGGTVEAVPSTFWPSAGVNRPENGDVQRVWETFVSKDDLDGARAFVADFVTQHLVPFMEKTVANLNEQVASARRGLTGRLFTAGRRYFGVGASSRSPTTSPSLSEDGFMTLCRYAYSTPEAQMRRLADFAFMLRDWKLALSVYDTVRKDFQVEEKAIKYYAATLEMCGLCALLLESQPASAIRTTQFDACVDKYKETKSKPLWLRAALAYLAVMRSKGWWKESAAICLKMTAIEDSDLLSALWLEQAALSFQRNVPPLTRKYAFHMVLAGHRYYKCGERDFAALCYYLASTVLHSSRWSLAEDHINFTLGRQSYHLGDLQHAMTYFVRLVRASKQPPSQQAIFLKEFLHVCEQTALAGGGRLGPIDLGVPDWSMPTAPMRRPVTTCGQTWRSFWSTADSAEGEPRLCDRSAAKGAVSMSSEPLAVGRRRHAFLCSVSHADLSEEPLYLCTDARNPLGVPITLTDVSVRCQFAGSIEKDIPREQEAATDSGFELNVIDSIEFAPGETKTAKQGGSLAHVKLNLGIVPRREGRVVVHGVSYKFFGVVPAAFSFSPDGTPTRTKVSSRTSALQADVMQPMPLLQAVFQDVPDRLVSGEARRASLELFNKGSLGMGNVLVGISHPGFFWFGEDGPSDDPMAFGRAEAESAGPAAGHAAINNSLETMVVVSLSDILKREGKHPTLAPGQSVRITTWVRGDRIGKHAFRLLFGYQSEAAAEEYRTLRHSLSIAVLPSLRINAFTRPSAKHLSEFVLGLEIENLKDSPLNLNNLVAVSPSWRMLPFGEASR
ncbi:ER-golgi trafficking TRAPP I complex 85 kDa subunit-domain-containing protein [Hyaloraphidium curvatum]|nr:ER-golgi trafficking TRAPP I complex 85 kDa subunit-domain-containing protein [Hyaloraphidium curvatum]